MGYNVTYTDTNSEVRDSVFSESNTTVIRPLNPFTSYAISVSAVTNAGSGPYSTVVIVTTDEAGTLINYL